MANKTFWKGEWHLVAQLGAADANGRLGGACAPFLEGEDVKWVAAGSYGASGNFVRAIDASQPARPAPRLGTRAYKVVTQADPWFAGEFGPAKLEGLLNELGGAGWRVVGVAGPELVIVLERVVDEAHVAEERRRGEVRSPASPA